MNASSVAWRVFEVLGILSSILSASALIYWWSKSRVDPRLLVKYPGSLFYKIVRYIGYTATVMWTWCVMLRVGANKPLVGTDIVETSRDFVFLVMFVLALLLFWFLAIESFSEEPARSRGKGLTWLLLILLMLCASSAAYAIDTLQVFGA